MEEVAVYRDSRCFYPEDPPFHPDRRYAEYPFEGLSRTPNPAYEAVRGALQLLGLDDSRRESPDWNPFRDLVKPGDTVVVKPNLVRHFHDRGEPIEAMVTHGSVVRAVTDYVVKALGGDGAVIICDAPQDDGDFELVSNLTGLARVVEFYRAHGVNATLLDLRPEMVTKKNGVPVERHRLGGDPRGYVECRLNRQSAFADGPRTGVRYRGSEYDNHETWKHHHDDIHEYLISGTVLGANAVFNVPKLKTHKKAGISVCMKNLVGVNGNKNWLPHHREGTPEQGGDQYASSGTKQRLEYFLLRNFKSLMPRLGAPGMRLATHLKRLGGMVFGETDQGVIRSGNWYGNDTVWRMVVDLNRALMYAAADGSIKGSPQRKLFSIVDGIVGGQGNSPFSPERHESSIILAGVNPVAVDSVAATLMGFDCEAIPQIANAYREHELRLAPYRLEDIACRSNVPEWNLSLGAISGPYLRYKPHGGWRGHIELDTGREKAGR